MGTFLSRGGWGGNEWINPPPCPEGLLTLLVSAFQHFFFHSPEKRKIHHLSQDWTRSPLEGNKLSENDNYYCSPIIYLQP